MLMKNCHYPSRVFNPLFCAFIRKRGIITLGRGDTSHDFLFSRTILFEENLKLVMKGVKFTPRQVRIQFMKKKFLEQIAKSANISEAARVAGIDRAPLIIGGRLTRISMKNGRKSSIIRMAPR